MQLEIWGRRNDYFIQDEEIIRQGIWQVTRTPASSITFVFIEPVNKNMHILTVRWFSVQSLFDTEMFSSGDFLIQKLILSIR